MGMKIEDAVETEVAEGVYRRDTKKVLHDPKYLIPWELLRACRNFSINRRPSRHLLNRPYLDPPM